MTRRLPRPSELRPYLRMRPLELDPTRRRPDRARSVFDYTDGAAEAEISLRRGRRLFRELELRPSVFRDRLIRISIPGVP